jgi:potassium-dependent mechanosensitive channel
MKELIVPNKNFITGELEFVRSDFTFGIAYGSDTEKAQSKMLEVCKKHPAVLDYPSPDVFFTSFGDNSLNFDVKFFVKETTNRGRNQVIHDLHMAVDKICRIEGIEISFPQRDLHLKSSDITLKIQQV